MCRQCVSLSVNECAVNSHITVVIVSLNIQAVNFSNLALVTVSVNVEVVNFIFNLKALIDLVGRKFVDPDRASTQNGWWSLVEECSH